MPNPRVNQIRDGPSAQPTISLALLVQVGAIPGLPGASPSGFPLRSRMPCVYVPEVVAICKSIFVSKIANARTWDGTPRYLIRDRDRVYGAAVTHFAPLSPTSVILFKAVLRSLRKYQTPNATTDGCANALIKLATAL